LKQTFFVNIKVWICSWDTPKDSRK